jgi:TolA-binding protein
MDAEISQSEQWLRFVAWLEDNWRRVAGIGSIAIGVGIVVAFFIWQGGEKQRTASEKLSLVLASPEPASSDALLIVANDHAGTEAGKRARLLAAAGFYKDGQYEKAQTEFERFLAGQPAESTIPEARLGVAACKEAQGQTDGAITDYLSIVGNPASGNVIAQARFALGNLYVQQGQPDLARVHYEELAKNPGSSLAAEAQARLVDLPPSAASRQVEVPLAPLAAPGGMATNLP